MKLCAGNIGIYWVFTLFQMLNLILKSFEKRWHRNVLLAGGVPIEDVYADAQRHQQSARQNEPSSWYFWLNQYFLILSRHTETSTYPTSSPELSRRQSRQNVMQRLNQRIYSSILERAFDQNVFFSPYSCCMTLLCCLLSFKTFGNTILISDKWIWIFFWQFKYILTRSVINLNIHKLYQYEQL